MIWKQEAKQVNCHPIRMLISGIRLARDITLGLLLILLTGDLIAALLVMLTGYLPPDGPTQNLRYRSGQTAFTGCEAKDSPESPCPDVHRC